MAIINSQQIHELEKACQKLSKMDKISHVGVINPLGHLIAGGFKDKVDPLLNQEKVTMLYMQMQLDFNMRKELDEILGPIDYIASRRTKQLIISVPEKDNLVLIVADPDADDKQIIKKAEELFDNIQISVI